MFVLEVGRLPLRLAFKRPLHGEPLHFDLRFSSTRSTTRFGCCRTPAVSPCRRKPVKALATIMGRDSHAKHFMSHVSSLE
eukprot:scaffold181532_cov27-Prasinocladus_malaysianus.AAC.1